MWSGFSQQVPDSSEVCVKIKWINHSLTRFLLDVYVSELIIGHVTQEQLANGVLLSLIFLLKHSLNVLTMHLVTLSPQMPQVMDRGSEGIDLHYWGQVLKATSEKLQLVSAPEFVASFHPSSFFSLLLPDPAGSEAPLFLALQETCLFRCSVWRMLTEEAEEWAQQC